MAKRTEVNKSASSVFFPVFAVLVIDLNRETAVSANWRMCGGMNDWKIKQEGNCFISYSITIIMIL
ncbi:MAG: hypothetical protein Q8907_11245 [Bacteroidota bacterium]|nr:hypothetical protein [Bacteroidota bacterium]